MESIFAKNGSETPEPVRAEVKGEFQTKTKYEKSFVYVLFCNKKGRTFIYQIFENVLMNRTAYESFLRTLKSPKNYFCKNYNKVI